MAGHGGTWRDMAGHGNDGIEACCQVSCATWEHECAGFAMGRVPHQESLLLTHCSYY